MIAICEVSKRPKVEDNLGLAANFVISHFGRKRGRILIPTGGKPRKWGIPVEDTEEYSIACEALVEAVRTYDLSSGNRFSTYAYHCMKNAFLSRWRKKAVPLQLVGQQTLESIKENCTLASDPQKQLSVFLADEKLDSLDRKMMIEHFLNQKTYAEVGKIYGVTKMRVKQRIDRAIATIRKTFDIGGNNV